MIAQKYKFFINNKVLILCQNPGLVEEILENDDLFIIKKYESQSQLQQAIDILYDSKNNSQLIIYHSDLEQLKQYLLSLFNVIEAAGGVVENKNQEILLIYRLGFWDLPKGKIEEGENPGQAAIREVEEETGVQNLFLGEKIHFKAQLNEGTYHSYFFNGQPTMKLTYWYKMRYHGQDTLVPQTEEDIEQAIWVSKTKLSTYYKKMYPSIREIL
ncbi:MAG: NUDIX domain-containing protein [Chitinophagales bacterium]|nr:NUDIX domain-containing protein [Chitinophagales bacterium]